MRNVFAVFVAGIFAGLAAVPAWTQSAPAQAPSPNGAKVYLINLKDGQEVTSPFLVQFGPSGMGVAPAGVEKPNTGHQHLLIAFGRRAPAAGPDGQPARLRFLRRVFVRLRPDAVCL